MAGRRSFGRRSLENLYAEEEHSAMLPLMKGRGGRGRQGRRGAAPPHEARWRPNLPSYQEWYEGPGHPRGPWRREADRFGPGFDEPSEHRYQPRHANQDRFRPGFDEPSEHRYQAVQAGQETRRRGLHERDRGRAQNRGGQRGPPPRWPGDSLSVKHLVEILAQCQNFSTSLLNLLEEHNLPPQLVRVVVGTHDQIFLMQDEMVTLAPRLKLCVAHCNPQGCQRRDTCDGLHMCPKFVLSWCGDNQACVLGHRWHTDHNLALLKRLSMEYVHFSVLRKLLRGGQGQGQGQKQDQEKGGEAGPLGVCKDYNEAGCDQALCSSLHVCLSFVVGLTTCSRSNCRLNHDMLSDTCCHLLRLHKLPVNEAPLDVVLALLQANPGLKDMTLASSAAKSRPAKPEQRRAGKDDRDKISSDSDKQRDDRKNRTPRKRDSDKDSSSDTTDCEGDSEKSHSSCGKGRKGQGKQRSHTSRKDKGDDTRGQGRRGSESSTTATDSGEVPDKNNIHYNSLKKQQNSREQQKLNTNTSTAAGSKQSVPQPPEPASNLRTLWAHDLHGDVTTPEICYYSVEGMCRDEAAGCSRLHAASHFHWQARGNEQDSRWFNLRPEQTVCIERAYCDPALNGVNLPRLEPVKLQSSVRDLILMLGREVWRADFATRSLINSSQNKKLQLRRLCTQSVAGRSIKAATHHWYFQDINNKWVMYGKVDTAGRKDCVSSVTSSDIEKHYLQKGLELLTFHNSKYTYDLDFGDMVQVNKSTRVSREVRRRPEPHFPAEKRDRDKTSPTSDLPSHWDAMEAKECSRMVTLAPTSDEYKKVVTLLGKSVSPSKLIKVERIQNPFMWHALRNKLKEMMAVYRDQSKLNFWYLFHGTSRDMVPSICAENFDRRLHGTACGQLYGQGTYFGTKARTSYKHCRADPNGRNYMFVATVAVGSMVMGNSSMVRPPINSATNMPYDSTVDDPANPKLVVKYSKQEYYPEYLLTLT